MLKQRVISAIIMAVAFILILFVATPYYFSLAFIFLCGLALWEWTGFCSFNNPIIRIGISVILATVAFLYVFSVGDFLNFGRDFGDLGVIVLIVGLLWWLLALFLVITYPQKSNLIKQKLNVLLMGLLTLVPFFIGAISLRVVNYNQSPLFGAWLLLYVFVLVWAADTGAYFSGRKFGKNKLCPAVSPGKTLEGLYGGVGLSILVTLIITFSFPQIIPDKINPLYFIGLSIITTLVSVLGDLSESMFKRSAKIKDSSHLIPGHGGIMDRLDSVCAAVSVFALGYIFFLKY